ncbi:MAG: Flp family type IVb pilin [Acidobacteria bacterium]|nr:Flp family type IVb pilin [Acidobacteriota bacterium]
MLGLYVRIGCWFASLRERAREEKGAAAVEYGLLVALIAAVIVVVVKTLGQKVNTGFETVNSNMP